MIDSNNYRYIFEKLLSSSDTGIAVMGTDGIIEVVNPKFARFLDKHEEEIIGKTVGDLIRVTDRLRKVPVKDDKGETVAFLVYAEPYHFIPKPAKKVSGGKNMTLRDRMAAYEKEVILEILERCGYNYTQAAKEAGVHRSLLYKKTAKYRISRTMEKKEEG